MEATQQLDCVTEALRIIDEALAATANVNIVQAGEMSDLFLDLRILVSEIAGMKLPA